jgi:hypothetical protein
VLPVGANKRPLVEWKEYQKRLPTRAEVEAWFTEFPHAGVGIITGPVSGGLLVVDVDGAKNPFLDDPERKASLSVGAIQKTPSGGRHFLMRCPAGVTIKNSASKLAHKVDIRCDGGYIVAAPSSGYEWLPEFELDCQASELGEAPRWVVDKLREVQSKQTSKTDASLWQGVGEGQRNETLAKLAGRLLARGLDREEVEIICHDWNSKNTPPLTRAEVDKTIQSIAEREMMKGISASELTEVYAGKTLEKDAQSSVLKAASEQFGIQIAEVWINPGAESRVEMVVNGVRAIMAMDDLTTHQQWGKMIARAAWRFPASLPKGQKWSDWQNKLLAAAKIMEVTPDAFEEGHVAHIVRSMIGSEPPYTLEQLTDVGFPFTHGGKTYCALHNLENKFKLAMGPQVNQRRVTQMLKSAGCSRVQIRTLTPGLPQKIWVYDITPLLGEEL